MIDQPEEMQEQPDEGYPEPPTEEELRVDPRPDQRQPAFDAVYAYIRALGQHLPPDPVHRNAIIWRAVTTALDATPVGRCISSHCVEGDHILDLDSTPTPPPEAADGRESAPQAPGGHTETPDGGNEAQTGAHGSALREMIAAAMLRTIRSYGEMPTPDVIRLINEMAQAVLNDLLPTTRLLGELRTAILPPEETP